MKKIFKGLLLCICIIFLTSCNRGKFTEKEIPLPKEIKNLSRVIYLGENIYGIDIGSFTRWVGGIKDYKLVNNNGNLILNKKIVSIIQDTNFSSEKVVLVYIKNKNDVGYKWSLINKDGKVVSDKYDNYAYKGKGIYSVLKKFNDGCYSGYCNSHGKEIIKLSKFIELNGNDNVDCMIYRNKSGKYGFINLKGETVIPFIFDDFGIYSDDLKSMTVCKNKKWGIIDKTGKVIIPFEFDYIEPFKNGLAKVCLNKKYGFIDKNKKFIVPCKFVDVFMIKKGMYQVVLKSNNKYNKYNDNITIIDDKGNYMIKVMPRFNVNYMDDKNIVTNLIDEKGVSLYNGKEQHQLLDIKGRLLTKESYDEFYYYKNDLFLVKKNKKYGLINRKGTTIAKVKYDNLFEFNDGFSICNLNGKYGVLDKMGHYKINPKYENIKYIPKGYFAVKFKNKWGIVNSNDKIIKPIEYDDISRIESKIKCDYNVLIKNKNKGLLMNLE